jgi:hypothetical protein
VIARCISGDVESATIDVAAVMVNPSPPCCDSSIGTGMTAMGGVVVRGTGVGSDPRRAQETEIRRPANAARRMERDVTTIASQNWKTGMRISQRKDRSLSS